MACSELNTAGGDQSGMQFGGAIRGAQFGRAVWKVFFVASAARSPPKQQKARKTEKRTKRQKDAPGFS